MKYYIIIGFILASGINLQAQQVKLESCNSISTQQDFAFADTNSKKNNNFDSSRTINSDSTKMGKNNQKCRMKDKFIDNDGDGINDNRCFEKGSGCSNELNCKGMGLGLKKRKGKLGGRT
jgi:hypothetical protein